MNDRGVIIGGMRTPFARVGTAFAKKSNLELLSEAAAKLVERFGLRDKRLGEVAVGAVMNHSKDWTLAREVVFGSGLDPETPAVFVQRACATSLEAAMQISHKIMAGQIDVGIAGGSDSMSDLPLGWDPHLAARFQKLAKAKSWRQRGESLIGFHPRELKPVLPAVTEPSTGLSMGQHCEKMAKEWEIAREDQDALAL